MYCNENIDLTLLAAGGADKYVEILSYSITTLYGNNMNDIIT